MLVCSFSNSNLLICDQPTYFWNDKSSMFTNLLLWTLFILACTKLCIRGSVFLSSKIWINLRSFLTIARFYLLQHQIKYVIFSSRFLFLELIKASAVCNKTTSFSALHKFTELGETFWALFSVFSFASVRWFELFECLCDHVYKLKHDAFVYIKNILTLIDIQSFYGSHVGK